MTVRIDRDGWSLEAQRSGSGSNVILLGNSLGADRTMWEPQRAVLEAHCTVLSYDTRGHGGADTPTGDYSFDDLVADAVAVLDHFDVKSAAYMGLSLGGMTGLGLALAHPDRITRLVCADARADAPEPFVKSWDDRIATAREGDMEALWDGTAERWFTAEWRAANPHGLAAVKAMFLRTTVEGYAGCAAALKRLDYLSSLGKLSMPVLYICGDADMAAPPDAMRAMAGATSGGEFVLVKDAAHLANLDNPQDFNAAITRFLGLA